MRLLIFVLTLWLAVDATWVGRHANDGATTAVPDPSSGPTADGGSSVPPPPPAPAP